MTFTARQFTFRFPRPALVMGILNVTPDSFSDGGHFMDPEAAVAQAESMVAQGADLIDVGAESTRPGAAAVEAREEWRRLQPVVQLLVERISVPISIDTVKPEIARRALDAGASVINDVAAHRTDDAMASLVAEFRAGYVLMHMRGNPQTMQENPVYEDVIREIGDFFAATMDTLAARGVLPEQIVLDPGLGFGKTLEHNLQLLRGLASFKKCRRPLLVGASRKSFIGRVTGADDARKRLPGSLACACLAVAKGASIVRAHDVAETRAALRMTEAVMTGESP